MLFAHERDEVLRRPRSERSLVRSNTPAKPTSCCRLSSFCAGLPHSFRRRVFTPFAITASSPPTPHCAHALVPSRRGTSPTRKPSNRVTLAPTQPKIRPPIPMRLTVDEPACCGHNSCAVSSPSTSCAAPAVPRPIANSSAFYRAAKLQMRSTISCAPSASPPCHRRVPKRGRRRKWICPDSGARAF